MEQIRAFIAIELPEEIKAALTRLETELKARGHYPVKWVDPAGIHLTLKFLGYLDAGKVEAIAATIGAACKGVPPFHLEVKGLGAFPNLRRVQVAWVGLSGDLEPLLALKQKIESNVALLGFPTESRAFSPHLTIARMREQASPADRQGFGDIVTAARFDEALSFTADAVHLMRSVLTPRGAIYSRLASVKLEIV